MHVPQSSFVRNAAFAISFCGAELSVEGAWQVVDQAIQCELGTARLSAGLVIVLLRAACRSGQGWFYLTMQSGGGDGAAGHDAPSCACLARAMR